MKESKTYEPGDSIAQKDVKMVSQRSIWDHLCYIYLDPNAYRPIDIYYDDSNVKQSSIHL